MAKEVTRYFKTKEFEKQRKIWYKKLADQGFVDQEQWENMYDTENFPPLKYLTEFNYDYNYIEAKRDYFMKSCQYLWDDDAFSSKLERDLWQCHSDGLTLAETIKDRRDRRCKTIQKTKIADILTETRKKMLAAMLRETDDRGGGEDNDEM